MSFSKFIGVILVMALIFSFSIPSFSETKKEYMGQLSQARKDFISQRDKLHDQDRLLRIAWHSERELLYGQAKASPKDKAIKEQLNEGAKKFFANKKAIYRRLEQLRKNWLSARKDLGAKIKNTK
ncbi:MAG: hypothetical protein Q8O30_12980 [Candidatus Omnitrophota bacterium]|nr:hypothetical protein [Candidatus Omnitrophota bacterium]